MHATHTFLFTDLEGSTRTWERDPTAMARWLASHDRLLTAAIRAHDGRVFKHTGDGLCAVFASVAAGVRAARDIQTSVATNREQVGPLRVRVAVHAGDAIARGDDFYGPTLNRCARLLGIGHGGQVLLSQATAALLTAGPIGDDVEVIDLGHHRLRDLQRAERVWQLVAPGLERTFPPLKSLDAFAHNLPVQRSSFVGRSEEMRAVRALLADHRLVTVIGVGGGGKTRLALEVAVHEVERFPDGVFFADLSDVLESGLVGSTIAGALGVPPGSGTSDERLIQFLTDRRVLIVVDNCEQVLDGCARVIDRVLTHCPDVSVLATSREPLAIDGEHVWRVPALSLPAVDATERGESFEEIARAESVRLFADRASAVRPEFGLTPQNAAEVAEICRRLDGIPLAIELAAARVAHLAPREIVERLADRFRLLSAGRRGVQRQQTLHAVLSWSHDLLDDSERALLRRLAVFAGGWTLDAAQGVCAGDDLDGDAIVDLLGKLVMRSLVIAEDRGDYTRYRMLETVRMYALERLIAAGDALRIRTNHAAWYLARVERSPDGSDVAGVRLWRNRLGAAF